MNSLVALLILLTVMPALAQKTDLRSTGFASASPSERLGTVSFSVSCNDASAAPFNRGVALLHDFWYAEAHRQFEQIVKSDPGCAMAHWGLAMSVFHEIWDRPAADTMNLGWKEMQVAQSLPAGTARERGYISALADFYRPGSEAYPARIAGYSSSMAALYAKYPEDVDAGAFYALSLQAAKAPDDTSLTQERMAMKVLTPLMAKYPDNPGVVHYIIHACDNPAMAREGLAAADHYGQIAQSGPHAFHMPGHIYARLGMWPQDIASQLGSIRASQRADANGESGIRDEPHSYDFLIYAYLQSGQDLRAKKALQQSGGVIDRLAAMPDKGANSMAGMIPYYRVKLRGFYTLEMRDWKTAAAMEPAAGSPPEVAMLVYWARALSDGHLRQPVRARADLAHYDELLTELGKGKRAFEVDATDTKIQRREMVAWTAYAEGKQDDALKNMRAAADLQDQVGQGEVDIPAREMLADMLLAFGQPRQALAEYKVSLKLSPNRLNGLYNAGRSAEAAGEKAQAEFYYAAVLKSGDHGANSVRPEFAHAASFLSSNQLAAR